MDAAETSADAASYAGLRRLGTTDAPRTHRLDWPRPMRAHRTIAPQASRRLLLPLCLASALACLASPATAQRTDTLDVTAVGKDPRWKIVGRTTTVVDIKGKRALELSEGAGI